MIPRARSDSRKSAVSPTSVRRHGAAQRRVELVPLQDVAEIADAGGRERLDRAGRDRVDADVLLAQVLGEIAHARFERRLGHAHDVVVRHHLFRAVIGQRQQAAAVRHQLLGALGHGGERVAGDVHGHREIVGRGVDVAPLELLLVGEGDGVDDEIEVAPDRAELGEGGVERGRLGHVAVDQGRRAQRLDQGDDALLERLALIGEGELGALAGQRLGDAPGDRAIIGDPHDEAALAGHDARTTVSSEGP